MLEPMRDYMSRHPRLMAGVAIGAVVLVGVAVGLPIGRLQILLFANFRSMGSGWAVSPPMPAGITSGSRLAAQTATPVARIRAGTGVDVTFGR
jgi:hypothetical protein